MLHQKKVDQTRRRQRFWDKFLGVDVSMLQMRWLLLKIKPDVCCRNP